MGTPGQLKRSRMRGRMDTEERCNTMHSAEVLSPSQARRRNGIVLLRPFDCRVMLAPFRLQRHACALSTA
eukprot:2660760-Rhodomonas_salina.1